MKPVIILAMLAFLVSCSDMRQANDQIPTLDPTAISNPATGQVPTFNPTAIPNPTLSAMYYGPDPATDGVLSLEIEDTEQACYSLQSNIPIKFTLHNLTNEPVTFPVFGEGDEVLLEPILTSQAIYIYRTDRIDAAADKFVPMMTNLVTLSGYQTYENVYDYHLPIAFGEYAPSGHIQAATPSAGEYLLKFLLENHWHYDAHAWTGRIASNQIEICITE